MTAVTETEGFVDFRGHRVFYRIVGSGEAPGKYPLLTLHGGPGAAHDCLEPLAVLARTGRRVIFYDQLGCGRSDQPHDPALWTIDLFLEELAVVRRALQLPAVHLLGLSWGGMLGLEYATRQPPGIVSLIVASAPASMRQWMDEARRLRAELPDEVQRVLDRHERAGTTDDPEYQRAMMVFYERHVCRVKPWPDCVQRSIGQLMRNPEVYLTMNGPSEFHVTGTLREWSVEERLGLVRVPVLVTSGRYDECTPAMAETIQRRIPGSEWVLFEESAHFSHAEEPERYASTVTAFLERVERDRGRGTL
ncbi:MAG TPA: proline iminopeptidase-family hydrolase [bacterium]|nr:proline iminopeptidase-family hydrolase [bacterium]